MNDPATKLPPLSAGAIAHMEGEDHLYGTAFRERTIQLSLALELLEKADYAIGYVLDVRELKCMHPGRAVDDCCAVCLINKWRVRLDASGLLGEIGGTK